MICMLRGHCNKNNEYSGNTYQKFKYYIYKSIISMIKNTLRKIKQSTQNNINTDQTTRGRGVSYSEYQGLKCGDGVRVRLKRAM